MTDPVDRRPSTSASPDSTRSTTAPVIAAVCGALGVVTALIPGLFIVAWVLGGIAIAVGFPTFRDGRRGSGYGAARVAVFAGGAAVLLGVVNLGIMLDWFTYFTTDGAISLGAGSGGPGSPTAFPMRGG